MTSIRKEATLATIINRVNIKSIQIYVYAYESKSVRSAAARCEVSQPAAMKKIQAIEDALNIKLFIRTSSGLEPTEAGKRTYDACRRVLETVSEWAGRVCDVRNGAGHTLSIAVAYGYYTDELRGILSNLTHALPNLNMVLIFSSSSEAAIALKTGRVDIAIGVPLKNLGEEFKKRKVQQITPVYALQKSDSNGNSDCSKINIFSESNLAQSFATINGRRWIMPAKGDQLREVMNEAIKGLVTSGYIEVSSVHEGLNILRSSGFALLASLEAIPIEIRDDLNLIILKNYTVADVAVIAYSKEISMTPALGYLNRVLDGLDDSKWGVLT